MYLPDGVTGPQTNPLGDGTVLLLGFGKLLLGAETLVALYIEKEKNQQAVLSGWFVHFWRFIWRRLILDVTWRRGY